jgi:hypothetical protein
VKISVKGEFAFGLPLHYEEVEIDSPNFDAIMDHFQVDKKVRKHLLPLVNDEVTTLDRTLEDGDVVILSSPYSGG